MRVSALRASELVSQRREHLSQGGTGVATSSSSALAGNDENDDREVGWTGEKVSCQLASRWKSLASQASVEGLRFLGADHKRTGTDGVKHQDSTTLAD